jgi:hypothetical protein
MARPQNWLDAAFARISVPELAGADPDALVDAAARAASFGLAPYDGRFVAGPWGVTFLPDAAAMKAALLACDLSSVLVDVVRPGDGLDVEHGRGGTVLGVRHDRKPGGSDLDFTHVWAFASRYTAPPPVRETVLLDRAEVEGLAAYRLFLPVAEPAHQTARRIALILLAERLDLEPAWAPVRRWREMVQAMWRQAA